ncbi:MAG: class I SAM-dependent DNA methyltransferase [Woeseiaceae bacterium]
MTSYRTSHIGEKRGERYDATHANKVDALIWDAFIKDFVSNRLQACAADGGTRYLDFACGTGRVLKVGSQHFDHCVGVDISDDMLAVARERIPSAEFVCTDVTANQDAVPGEFDCVTLFRFLLNAEESLSLDILAWLAAHMRPGAILVGNVHMNTLSFRGLATLVSNGLFGTSHNHLSRRKTTQMLENSGFRIQAWSGYRILPTVMGKPIFGRKGQIVLEKFSRALGLGALGSELVFVAERI